MAPSSSLQDGDENYTIIRTLAPTRFLVRRESDGETLLGRTWAPTAEPGAPDAQDDALLALLERGAGASASALLNHENLVSVAGSVATQAFGAPAQRLLLWDHCDAGTLANLLAVPPVRADATGFLPESLVWHVARSLLRALAWLHHGYRAEWTGVPVRTVEVDRAGGGEGAGTDTLQVHRREFREWIADPDWLPVLHRAIQPENIYFQHPRGGETYGLCKLGNFSKCFVSGHVNGKSTVGRVVVSKEGISPLVLMKELLADQPGAAVRPPKESRPYTSGSEMFAIGAVLYQMMTGNRLADPDECSNCGCWHLLGPDISNCQHRGCEFQDVDLVRAVSTHINYTASLQRLVRLLLSLNRLERSAIDLLELADMGFSQWRRYSEDAMYYVDLDDELREREMNYAEKFGAEAMPQGVVRVSEV